MNTRSLLLVAVAVAVCCAATATEQATAITVGSWQPIKDISDPHVQELGRWAVAEANKAAPSNELTFRRVTGGEQQVVAGVNYRLDVAASSRNDMDGVYKAVLYEQDWTNTRKLISLDKIHS
ncbi:hypothetical protein ABZP36_018121 [Zizania latifolia]